MKLGLGLPAKANDDVGCKGKAPNLFPARGHHAPVVIDRVRPEHPLEHAVGPRLDGEVQVLAHFLQAGHGIDQLGKHEARVRGDEADALEASDLVQLIKHVVKPNGSSDRPSKVCPVHALPVRVDRLTQERDLPDPAVDEGPCLIDDLPNGPADFLPAGSRHDAKSASLIAAPHDRDKGLGWARTQVFGAGEARRRLQIELQGSHLPLLPGKLNQLGQAQKLAGAADDAHLRVTLEDRLAVVLRAAAQDSNHQIRSLPLERLEGSDLGKNAVFRLLAHRAGIVKNHPRAADIPRNSIAALEKNIQHELGVELVHLTAEDLKVDALFPGNLAGV